MDFFYVFEKPPVILENCHLHNMPGNKPPILPQVPTASGRGYKGLSAWQGPFPAKDEWGKRTFLSKVVGAGEILAEVGKKGNVSWQTSMANHILTAQAVLELLPPFKLQLKATVVLLVCGQRKRFEQGQASVHKPWKLSSHTNKKWKWANERKSTTVYISMSCLRPFHNLKEEDE